MTINCFIKENYPKIYEEYKRFSRKNVLPKIGDWVEPVRNGFGRCGRLKVIAHVKKDEVSGNNSTWGDDYIVLDSSDGQYLSKPTEWWKDFKIVKK